MQSSSATGTGLTASPVHPVLKVSYRNTFPVPLQSGPSWFDTRQTELFAKPYFANASGTLEGFLLDGWFSGNNTYDALFLDAIPNKLVRSLCVSCQRVSVPIMIIPLLSAHSLCCPGAGGTEEMSSVLLD